MYISNFFSYILQFQEYKTALIAIRFICFFLSFFVLLKSTVLIKRSWLIKLLLFCSVCVLNLVLTQNLFYFDIMSVIIFSLLLSFFSKEPKELVVFMLAGIIMALFIFVSALALNGKIESKSFEMASSYGFSVKHSLGFLNPNIISMLLLSIITLLYVYKKSFLFFISTIVFLALSLWLGSRTYMLASLLSLMMIPFIGKLYKFRFFVLLYLLLPLVLYGILYTNKLTIITDLLNYALSGRLTLISEYISTTSHMGLLFGGINFEKVDMAYFNLIFAFGVFGYLLFIFLVFTSFKKLNEIQLYMLFVILFVMMFENVISFNCILMAVLLSDIFARYGIKLNVVTMGEKMPRSSS
tara:strand:- start:3049 stop:4110 length:1062 start_codon:yes stop_codon:yes gene_type:complete